MFSRAGFTFCLDRACMRHKHIFSGSFHATILNGCTHLRHYNKIHPKQQRYPNRNDDVWRLRKKQMCQISEYWNPGCNCVVLKCCFSAQELKRRFRSHKKAFLQLQELPLRDIFQGCFWRRKGAYSTVGTCELAKCAGRGASLICYTWNTIFVKKKEKCCL